MKDYDVTFKGARLIVSARVSGNRVRIASYTPFGEQWPKVDAALGTYEGKPESIALEAWSREDLDALARLVFEKHYRT